MSEQGKTPAAAQIIVVMGVSGSGKSTIARLLANRLGWRFLDADDLHSEANIARMSAGIALDDADRMPWLDAIADWMRHTLAEGRSAVVACSALRRTYRERLGQAGPVRFVYLAVDRAELTRRLHAREHFMPATLLGSQLATLEEPADDEPALRVNANGPVEEVVALAWQGLARTGSGGIGPG